MQGACQKALGVLETSCDALLRESLSVTLKACAQARPDHAAAAVTSVMSAEPSAMAYRAAIFLRGRESLVWSIPVAKML